jgi:FlaA1/EpsC-like NDP-sugar epimerase
MAIFARKHFAKDQAKVFSLLIYFAIAIRAGAAIIKRFIKHVAIPLLDAIILYTGLYFIKDYYEHNIKFLEGGAYPDNLVFIAFSIYVFIWISSVFLSSGYDKPVRLQKIMRGIFFGTGIILSLYALLPEQYRFSRALILMGTGWAIISLLGTRMLFHLFRISNFSLEGSISKRIAIVGSEDEYKRVYGLLKESSVKIGFAGFVLAENADGSEYKTENYIGNIKQLNDIIENYKIEEVIFCAKNISSERIIDLMTESKVEFKIAPQGSSSIIGSNSIDTAGDLYSIDINSINKPSNQRKKIIVDYLLSILFLLLSPLLFFIVKRPFNFLLNCTKVLLGINTWVGYENTENFSKKRKGILFPADALKNPLTSQEMCDRLNKIYAKDYSTRNDLQIILKGIKNIGR